MAGEEPLVVRRHKTAIRRYACSRPIAIALADGLITKASSVLDYGCGLGADIQYLRQKGVVAAGWDPHFLPDGQREPADIVNLGYVLNVIEDSEERRATLLNAFGLARQAFVVSVRVDKSLGAADECGDGCLTSRGTFQKIYTQAEFRDYVEQSVGRRSHAVGLGVIYVFASEEGESAYLARRAFARRLEYRSDLVAEFKSNRLAQRFVALANKLGRLPLPEEFRSYEKLKAAFGSSERLARLALQYIDRDAFAGSRAQRQEDILFFLAMLRLQGLRPPPVASLPATIRTDIKAIWPSYTAAQSEAESFLFRIGEASRIKECATSCGIGKLVADDLYVHESAQDDLPALLRLIIFAGQQIVGNVEHNVIKIRLDGRAVSFLNYPAFEEEAHPALHSSVRVYLPRAAYDIRNYADSGNPPILHRKDTLVLTTHPLREQFRQLTRAEEQLGLLSAINIGYQESWRLLLAEHGCAIDGHRLLQIPRASEEGTVG